MNKKKLLDDLKGLADYWKDQCAVSKSLGKIIKDIEGGEYDN